MVIGNHSWEEETRKYLTEIQLELSAVDKQLEVMKAKRDNLAREAEAYELALQSRLKRTGRQDITKQDIREILINQTNHEERLTRIAEQNNGVIKVGLAADILFNNRMMKSKSRMNAYRTVYGLMVKMVEEGIFQKTGKAEFRLVGTKTKLPSVT